jgi:hypothetical protein
MILVGHIYINEVTDKIEETHEHRRLPLGESHAFSGRERGRLS